ncbi:enoyl-CoA hydratase/isomerase family protein [Oceanicoccus sp. KOV_DT_Chl]|uniref:enoyl-CoA hydratase/isomerase family protein n=1 Tax=Oceanicoccus sp. KOV_DT_Chl TaxID=1904639 RepID=UPI000C7E8193|nr:enoyl-CoA hydratase/isomerase family protein [Oceanicoccus sp. KOV_DT_Chl]
MKLDKITSVIDERGIATVTLNNPDKHNAFDDQIVAQLTHIFLDLNANAAVRVVILAAKGKSFSAGADLNWMKRMANYSVEENLVDAKKLALMLHTLYSLSKPTIARVQGAAFGGGVGLVSCCDMAIAAEHASFSLSEVKLGMVPATISPYVIEAIGPRAARRYFMTAERFTAATAFQLGLVNECVAQEQLDASIATITDALLTNGPAAVTSAKQLISEIKFQAIDQALIKQTSELIATIRSSAEGKEGLGAFLEKRQPNWINAATAGE